MKFNIGYIQKSACSKRNGHLFTNKPNKQKVPNKYMNIEVEYNGKKFTSIAERDRYITLSWKFKIGEITEPLCQIEYILETEDKKICSYIADFVYTIVKTGQTVVEDVKSPKTRLLAAYRLKRKLMMANLKIEIKEV